MPEATTGVSLEVAGETSAVMVCAKAAAATAPLPFLASNIDHRPKSRGRRS